MKYTHGIVAINIDTGSILHLVAYEEEPSSSAWVSLYKELKDPEFAPELVDVDFLLIPAPKYLIDDVYSTPDNYDIIVHDT